MCNMLYGLYISPSPYLCTHAGLKPHAYPGLPCCKIKSRHEHTHSYASLIIQVNCAKNKILVNSQSALCEWTPPPSLEDQLPRPLNPILSHVVYRLLNMVDPPRAPPTPPQFPHFFMKACFVGKPFTGKSTVLQRLTQSEFGIKCPLCTHLISVPLSFDLVSRCWCHCALCRTTTDQSSGYLHEREASL